MPRTLITYVGNHDPRGGNAPGPVLSILDHLAAAGELPQRIVMLVSTTHQRSFPLLDGGFAEREQEGMEKQALETEAAIRERYAGRIDVVPVKIRVNPADLDEVIRRTLEALDGLVGGKEEVDLNVSSGTPAMSAAITFLAHSTYIRRCRVWQSLNPAKLPEGAVRVTEVKLDYLHERDRLERALALVKAMAFSRAATYFRETGKWTPLRERRNKAAATVSLMRVYALWDRGEYEEALELLMRTKDELQKLGGWEAIPVLQDQERALRRICQDREEGKRSHGEPVETPAILEDLHAGLLRRVRAGQFATVPTRARRLYEGILNYLLYQVGLDPRGPIDPGDALFKKLAPEVRKVIRNMAPKLTKPDLGVRLELVSVLAEAGMLTIQPTTLKALVSAYRKFADIRNRSIDEHGLSGVPEADAQAAAEAATKMLGLVFPGFTKRYPEHPFGTRAIDAVADGIRFWFGEALAPG